jgi:peptidyl-prolyl cis-trans isomerase SurA
MKGEDFGGLAQTNSADAPSQSQGGDLGWNVPGTYVPEFQQAIADLKDGEISEPFRTQFGWHIVQMLGRRRVDNTDEVRRHEAAEAIRASKADEETELWLRRLRDEAFVEFKS